MDLFLLARRNLSHYWRTNIAVVLGVTAAADSVRDATGLAYRGVDRVRFEGMHFRRDIGRGRR